MGRRQYPAVVFVSLLFANFGLVMPSDATPVFSCRGDANEMYSRVQIFDQGYEAHYVRYTRLDIHYVVADCDVRTQVRVTKTDQTRFIEGAAVLGAEVLASGQVQALKEVVDAMKRSGYFAKIEPVADGCCICAEES